MVFTFSLLLFFGCLYNAERPIPGILRHYHHDYTISDLFCQLLGIHSRKIRKFFLRAPLPIFAKKFDETRKFFPLPIDKISRVWYNIFVLFGRTGIPCPP